MAVLIYPISYREYGDGGKYIGVDWRWRRLCAGIWRIAGDCRFCGRSTFYSSSFLTSFTARQRLVVYYKHVATE
jgi:hypothetical protein